MKISGPVKVGKYTLVPMELTPSLVMVSGCVDAYIICIILTNILSF